MLARSLARWHAARRKGKKYREGRRKGRKNKGRKMLKDKAPQALQELEAGNYDLRQNGPGVKTWSVRPPDRWHATGMAV